MQDITRLSKRIILQFLSGLLVLAVLSCFSGNAFALDTEELKPGFSPTDFQVQTERNKDFVISGETVTVSFKLDRRAAVSGKVKIGEDSFTLQKKNGILRHTYTLSFTVPENSKDENLLIDFSEVSSTADGRETVSFESSSRTLKLVCPADETSLLEWSAVSDNVNPVLAKTGDTVTVHLVFDREVEIESAQLSGQEIQFTEDGTAYTGECILPEMSDSETLNLSLSIYDPQSEISGICYTREFEIRYYAPIQFENVAVSAEDGRLAVKKSDKISFTAAANHELSWSELTVGNETFSITGDRLLSSSGRIGDYSDQERFGYTLRAEDVAGNTAELSESDLFTFYTPIEVSDERFTSSNASETYIKNDDVLSLSFKTQHPVTVTGEYAGEQILLESGTSFKTDKSISGLSDAAELGYLLYLEDAAGNIRVLSAQKQYIYLAPIEAEVSIAATYEKTPGYAKEGDIASIQISPSHSVSLSSASLSGQSIDTSECAFNSVLDSSVREGTLVFTGILSDEAGNKKSIQYVSEIIYDRTAPNISMRPIVSLFTNASVSLNCSVTDVNLDHSSTKLLANGSARDAASSWNGSDLILSMTLSEENEYVLTVEAEDLAGNRTVSTDQKVIIDKTNPEITNIGLDFASKPVYATGLKASDLFQVEENYLKEISCLLSAKTLLAQTRKVDLDEEIYDEGLMSLSLSAQDMAGNQSVQVSYEFYLDGTAPKPILKASDSRTILTENSVNQLSQDSTIDVSLDEIWMGDSSPDWIEELKAVYSDGSEEVLIENGERAENAQILVSENLRKIELTATDSVGNQTGKKVYQISVDQKASKSLNTSSVSLQENVQNGLSYGLIAALAALVIGSGVVLFLKKKKNIN